MTTIGSGPPGIEVQHLWTPSGVFGGTRPAVTMNDRAARPARIKLTKITGSRSLAELEDAGTLNTGRRGGSALPSVSGMKTKVYEGEIQSKTLDGLRIASELMRAAFGERDHQGVMTLLGAPQWEFNARTLGYDEDDEQTTGWETVFPFKRGFQLNLRMYDSRHYVVGDQSVGAADATSATATNAGTAETDPVFTVAVNAGDLITLRSFTLDRTLSFDNLPAGTLTVDFNDRSARIPGALGRDDVSGYLDPYDCDWWHENVPGLIPGANSVRVTNHGTGSAPWTVTWRHASE